MEQAELTVHAGAVAPVVRGLRRRKVVKIVGWVVGLVLTVGAVWFAVRGADWQAVRDTPPGVLAGLCLLVLVNLWATAALFWAVTLLFPVQRRVGLGTMFWLIGVSAVFNYIPVIRAGLWGRAAYLKAWHGLRLRDSGLSLIYLGVVAAAVLGAVSAPLAAGYALQLHPGWGWLGALAALFALQLLFPFVMRRLPVPTQSHGHGWVWTWVPLRVLDLFAAVWRTKLSFMAVGVEMDWTTATLIGTSSLLVKLIGITPNGLGMAEWVVAALSDLLEVSTSGVGITAALIDRMAEVVATLLAGLVGGVGLWWDMRHHAKLAHPPAENGDATAGTVRDEDIADRKENAAAATGA